MVQVPSQQRTARQNVKFAASRSCLPGRASVVPLGKRDLLDVLAGHCKKRGDLPGRFDFFSACLLW
jgi:hypothetical protein